MAIYSVTLVLLIRGWRRERDAFRALLMTGVWILLLNELNLTFYATVTNLHNLLSHIYKTWGEGFVFWAVYAQAMDEPHRRLRRSERLLARYAAQTQALLRENQILLDNAFVGIFFVQDRRFIRVNRCAEALLGYAPGELDGVSAEVIYPDYAAFLALGERAYPLANRGEIFADEVELARKDGSRFWCLMRGQALTPEQPLDGFLWIMENVTERRQARQALEDAAGEKCRKLSQAVEQSPVSILITDIKGRIEYVNPAFRIKLSPSSSPKEPHVREAQVPVNRVVDGPA